MDTPPPLSDELPLPSVEMISSDSTPSLGGWKVWKPIILTLLIILAVPFWMFCYVVFLSVKEEIVPKNTGIQVPSQINIDAVQKDAGK